jgi:hypothetical protein
MSSEQPNRDVESSESLDTSRRAFLKTAGKVAVYVPPAMLAMYSPSFKAIAQSSGGGGQSPPSGLDWLAELLRKLFGR